MDVDHYHVLGLTSGEEVANITEKDISKAYKLKALELHPDKRPNDPNAHANFQKLKSSYEILKDEKARKLFDDLLRVKREHQKRNLQSDAKRRRMVSDLEERERASYEPDLDAKARDTEQRISRKLKEEIARIRAMHSNKRTFFPETIPLKKESMGNSGGCLDKEKMLKVSWEKSGVDYSPDRLKEIFSKFGPVEDVVIKTSKKRGSALVVMVSKDGAFAATGCVCGDLSNPLLVVPVQPATPSNFQNPPKPVESENTNKPTGAGFKNFEDSVLEKLQKAAAQKKK